MIMKITFNLAYSSSRSSTIGLSVNFARLNALRGNIKLYNPASARGDATMMAPFDFWFMYALSFKSLCSQSLWKNTYTWLVHKQATPFSAFHTQRKNLRKATLDIQFKLEPSDIWSFRIFLKFSNAVVSRVSFLNFQRNDLKLFDKEGITKGKRYCLQ